MVMEAPRLPACLASSSRGGCLFLVVVAGAAMDFDLHRRATRPSSLPPADRIFISPSDLRGTALARQGYLPDLEPLLTSHRSGSELGRALLPRSHSSPQCSPSVTSLSKLTHAPLDLHHERAGVCLSASPTSAPSEVKPAKKSPTKITYDRLWGTVCSMCSATLGAGALSLPYAFKQLGMAGGILALLVTASASHYSVVLLTSAIARTGTRSYEELTVLLFGKCLGVTVELNIIIFCFGSSVAYTVAVGDLLHPITFMWLSRKGIICVAWLTVLLPLSFAERLEALQFASVFGVLAVVYLVLSVVAHALLCAFASGQLPSLPDSDNAYGDDLDGYFDPEETVAHYWVWSTSSFEALAVMMFAFTCQVNVPSLYDELHQRCLPRMRAVSLRAIGICLGCYAAVGVAGYADAPASRSGNLLNNYCVQPMSEDGTFSSSMMLPAYVAMSMSVLMAYPLNIRESNRPTVTTPTRALTPSPDDERTPPCGRAYRIASNRADRTLVVLVVAVPCRYTLDVMCCQQFGAKKSLLRHCLWTLMVAGAGLLVALYVPAINIVFQLMGSTSSALVCFVLPAAFGLKLDLPEARGLTGKVACIALLVGGALLGAIATSVTIMGLLQNTGNNHGQVSPHLLACRRQCHY